MLSSRARARSTNAAVQRPSVPVRGRPLRRSPLAVRAGPWIGVQSALVRSVEFRQRLDDDNALRVRFDVDHGRVVQFVVQLETRFEGLWVPLVRYDSAHGFAHCDRLHPYEPAEKTRMPTQDFNEALTVALEDLAANWQRYRRRYVQWLLRS